jgi:hypothetical protein
MPSEADQIVKDLIGKTKSLASEKSGLADQIKALEKQVKALEEEVEDAVAAAEAANMGKSAVEKDWTERLVKVRLQCACCAARSAGLMLSSNSTPSVRQRITAGAGTSCDERVARSDRGLSRCVSSVNAVLLFDPS